MKTAALLEPLHGRPRTAAAHEPADPPAEPICPPPRPWAESWLPVETVAWLAAWPGWALAPRGDGHPVMVLPGFLMDDRHTLALRMFLRSRGHAAQGWPLGRNLGRWDVVDSHLLPALKRLRQETERRVSLVGWSLGGLLARELAWRAPGDVRCVVTLSSLAKGRHTASNVWPLYQWVSGEPAQKLVVAAPPVPSTSVFSRVESINAWQACLQPVTPHTENVEIVSTHHGMGLHPAAFYLIADRLAQPEGQWRPFQRPACSALLYPHTPGL